MKEKLDKLLFKTFIEMHPDNFVCRSKEERTVKLLETGVNFIESVCKIQDPNWKPSEEFNKAKNMLEEVKKSVQPKFEKGSVLNDPDKFRSFLFPDPDLKCLPNETWLVYEDRKLKYVQRRKANLKNQ